MLGYLSDMSILDTLSDYGFETQHTTYRVTLTLGIESASRLVVRNCGGFEEEEEENT
jgi:hypothetical protein